MTEQPAALRVGGGVLRLELADITTLRVDAMVNAANSHLAGGGGVDGAIHRAGGPQIMRELNALGAGCPTGSAVVTGAGRLAAQYVIHAVGPVYRAGGRGEADLLRSAYDSAFALAAKQGCATVASPSISTGAYGYPINKAAPIALQAAVRALAAPGTSLAEITFALLLPSDLQCFRAALERLETERRWLRSEHGEPPADNPG